MFKWDENQELRLQSGLKTLLTELRGKQTEADCNFAPQKRQKKLESLQASLSAYGQILLQWHNAFHLLGEQNPEDFVSLHLLDSIAGAFFLESQELLPERKNLLQLVDVGSGLGLPGLPLALYFLRYKAQAEQEEHKVQTQFALYLVEAAARRANILRSMVAELGLQKHVTICQHPIEQWRTMQSTVDERLLSAKSNDISALRVVTCRAFRPLNSKSWKLLQAARQGLLPKKGRQKQETSDIPYGVMLYKGNWQHATAELERLSLKPQAQSFYTLPQCGHKRSLFYWQI